MQLFSNNQFDSEEDFSDDQLAQAEAEASRQLDEEKLMARFGQSAKKSWLARNHGNRQTARRLSYFFNIISALAGLYGARILFQMIPVPIPYLDWALAIGFLFVLEKYKRQFSDKFWDSYFAQKKIQWGYALCNFGLLGVSLFLSVFGVYFAAKDFSPEAKYIGGGDNMEVVALQDQYRQIDEKLTTLLEDKSSYNHEGKFYYNLIPARTALENQLADINSVLKGKHGVINIQNEDILADWQLRNAFRGKFSVLITLLSELLFEICMAFGSYYDYRYCRALIARHSTKGRKREEEEPDETHRRGKLAALAG